MEVRRSLTNRPAIGSDTGKTTGDSHSKLVKHTKQMRSSKQDLPSTRELHALEQLAVSIKESLSLIVGSSQGMIQPVHANL